MGDVGVVWRDGHAMDAHESTPGASGAKRDGGGAGLWWLLLTLQQQPPQTEYLLRNILILVVVFTLALSLGGRT